MFIRMRYCLIRIKCCLQSTNYCLAVTLLTPTFFKFYVLFLIYYYFVLPILYVGRKYIRFQQPYANFCYLFHVIKNTLINKQISSNILVI